MASFRKRFQSNASQKRRAYSKGNRILGVDGGVWWTQLPRVISRPGERAIAMLAPKDYTSFWGKQGDKFKYLANLIKSVIQVDLEMRKNKHNVEIVQELLEMYCCLRNSITCLCLFENLNDSHHANRSLVKMAIKGYIKHFSGKGQLVAEVTNNHYIVYRGTKFIIHRLEKELHCGLELLLDSKFTIRDSIVKQCVYRCAFGNQYYAAMAQRESNNLTEFNDSYINSSNSSWRQRSHFLAQGNVAFWFSRLQELISASNPKYADNASEAYEAIKEALHYILLMTKQNATKSMFYSLSALTLTQWLMTIIPIENAIVLSEIARSVQVMTAWPVPYGYLAVQVLEKIYLESKLPGRTMWMHIEDIMGDLLHMESKELEAVSLNQVYMFSGENSHARSYAFQYFWDDIRDTDEYRKEYMEKVESMKRNFLIKIITSKINPEASLNSVDDFENVVVDKETLHLIAKTSPAFNFGTYFLNYIQYCMKAENANHWYDMTFKLLDEISNMDHESALSNRRMLLKKLILSMKTEFVDFLKQNVAFLSNEKVTKDTANTEEKLLKMAGDVIDKELCTKGSLHLTYKDIKKTLLEIVDEEAFNACKTKISEILQKRLKSYEFKDWSWSSGAVYRIILKSFRRSSETYNFPFTIGSGKKKYAYNADLAEFEDLIADMKQPINLCLLGGVSVVHRFVCAYVAFTYKHFKPNIRLFLIPSEHSFLAENIAAVDPWYCRNVYTPFCYPSWTVPFFRPPRLGDDESNDSLDTVEECNADKDIEGPIKIWSTLSQHYFQYAESTFSVPIFMCECWENLYDEGFDEETIVSSSNMCIPFCSSLEIGIYPEVYSSKYAVDNSANDSAHKDGYCSPLYEKSTAQLRQFLLQLNKDERENLMRQLTVSFRNDLKSVTTDDSNGVLPQIKSPGIDIENTGSLIRFCMSNVPEHEFSKIRMSENALYCSIYQVSAKCEEIISNRKNRKELRLKDINIIEECLSDHKNASTFIANKVSIKSSDGKSFHVMLDGEIYGPYSKLEISPTKNNLNADFQQFIQH